MVLFLSQAIETEFSQSLVRHALLAAPNGISEVGFLERGLFELIFPELVFPELTQAELKLTGVFSVLVQSPLQELNELLAAVSTIFALE